jgi:hypothetical protein
MKSMEDKDLKTLLDFICACYEDGRRKFVEVSVFNNIDMTRSEINFHYKSGSTKFETEMHIDWDKLSDSDEKVSYMDEKRKECAKIFEKIKIVTEK